MKKNLISIVILALLVVNIVLTSIMMFSVTSTNRKTAALVTDIASAISLDLGTEEEEAVTVPISDTSSYTISEMQIPLKKGEDNEAHFAMLTVTLLINTKHDDYKEYGEDLSTREDLIKGRINETVSQYTMDEINADSQMLKGKILSSIQEIFNSDFIFDITLQALYQ
ncbi:MAG: flagellar basal body-associated FliL family protein [Lachnospiraceae bacterium]|nr:flagellar basal body-associated FliL family protein [Lachnospiraceae bacterium]MDE7333701.1 flagellar basal body-associated FliL family protein [Lachnospiraceae bacterium]